MAFRSANLERLVKFNSASSCDLVDINHFYKLKQRRAHLSPPLGLLLHHLSDANESSGSD